MKTLDNPVEGPGYYDKIFTDGARWHCPAAISQYWPTWLVIIDRLTREGVPWPGASTGGPKWGSCEGVLDLGCGPGQFAEACYLMNVKQYHGLDFSPVAIERARAKGLGPAFTFARKNIVTDSSTLLGARWAITCLETLEHLEEDLAVLDRLRAEAPGQRLLLTVPSFGGRSHVRCFESPLDVLDRYGAYFADDMGLGLAPLCIAVPYGHPENGRLLFLLDGVLQEVAGDG